MSCTSMSSVFLASPRLPSYTRPQRFRTRPLENWRNERFIYRRPPGSATPEVCGVLLHSSGKALCQVGSSTLRYERPQPKSCQARVERPPAYVVNKEPADGGGDVSEIVGSDLSSATVVADEVGTLLVRPRRRLSRKASVPEYTPPNNDVIQIANLACPVELESETTATDVETLLLDIKELLDVNERSDASAVGWVSSSALDKHKKRSGQISCAPGAKKPYTERRQVQVSPLPVVPYHSPLVGGVQLLAEACAGVKGGSAVEEALEVSASTVTSKPQWLPASRAAQLMVDLSVAAAEADTITIEPRLVDLCYGQVHTLPMEGIVDIGRDADSAIPVAFSVVDDRHCVLLCSGGTVLVEDLSSHGTFINDTRVPTGVFVPQHIPLRSGDILALSDPDGPKFILLNARVGQCSASIGGA